VMHHMLPAKHSPAGVQNEPVKAIFKTVGVKKTQKETAEDSGKRVREKEQ